jgi:hypothetical protein
MGPRASQMTARRPVPHRHWRSGGDAPLPSGAEVLDEPFAAFPSSFMRIPRGRCGKDWMLNEAHTAHRDPAILGEKPSRPERQSQDWLQKVAVRYVCGSTGHRPIPELGRTQRSLAGCRNYLDLPHLQNILQHAPSARSTRWRGR